MHIVYKQHHEEDFESNNVADVSRNQRIHVFRDNMNTYTHQNALIVKVYLPATIFCAFISDPGPVHISWRIVQCPVYGDSISVWRRTRVHHFIVRLWNKEHSSSLLSYVTFDRIGLARRWKIIPNIWALLNIYLHYSIIYYTSVTKHAYVTGFNNHKLFHYATRKSLVTFITAK